MNLLIDIVRSVLEEAHPTPLSIADVHKILQGKGHDVAVASVRKRMCDLSNQKVVTKRRLELVKRWNDASWRTRSAPKVYALTHPPQIQPQAEPQGQVAA